MGTYRRVFIPSKFSSVENANKKHKSSVSARVKNGVVNVCIFDGIKSLLGKLKAFIEEKKVDYHTLLNEAHDMERYGDIEPGTAKEWVREQIKRTKQV